MIGIVIVGFGSLAHALLEAVQDITGPQVDAESLAVMLDSDLSSARRELRAAIDRCDSGSGVLIVTDLFGGIATELAQEFREKDRVEVVSGANIPMLIALTVDRHRNLADLAQIGRNTGQKYITVASEILGAAVPKRTRARRTDGRAEALETIERSARDLEALRRLLVELDAERTAIRGMGHNLPPPPDVDSELLQEGVYATQALGVEFKRPKPRAEVLRLCHAVLKRILKAVKALAEWVLRKSDRFVDGVVDSTSKAVGASILVVSVISQLKHDIPSLISFLEGLLARLWG